MKLPKKIFIVQGEKVIFCLNGEELTYDVDNLSETIKKLDVERPFELDFSNNEKIKVFITELSIPFNTESEEYGLEYFEGYIFK